MIADNTFYIRNYTDLEWKPTKSASLKVVNSVLLDYEEIVTLRCVLNWHIDAKELLDPKNVELRNKLQDELLKDIGYDENETAEDRRKLRIVVWIIDSLTSGRWMNKPYDRRTTYSPNKTTKIQQYKLWFDDSDD